MKSIDKFLIERGISSNLLKVVFNSGWLLLDKMVRLFLGLAVGAWVARYLGPDEFGELAYILAYIAFFQAVALLGLNGIVVRDISKNIENSGVILGTSFVLRLLAGIVCWLFAIITMAVLYGVYDQKVLLTILAGSCLVFQASDTIDLWFQSQSQSKKTVTVKLISYLTSNILKVVLILNNAPLVAFAAVMTLDFLFVSVMLPIAYIKFKTLHRWSFDKTWAKKILKESWPFILAGLSTMIYTRIDQIMIKSMLDTRSLGMYAAVLPLSTTLSFIPMILSTSLNPYISKKKLKGDREYKDALYFCFKIFSGVGLILSLSVCALAPWLVPLLYGDMYIEAIPVLMIHVFTNLFICLGVAQSLWILNEGRSKLSLYRTLAGACVCVVGNYFFIPMYGLIGAAVVSVLAQMTSGLLINIFISKTIFKMQVYSVFQKRNYL